MNNHIERNIFEPSGSAHERTHMGISKIDHYKWTMVDKEGAFRLIHKAALEVDDSYQRDPQRQEKIFNIASRWSWLSLGTLSVAERDDGRFYVFDGQNRLQAALKRSDISLLPCMVYAVESVAAEARAFVVMNDTRTQVSALDKHRANVVAEDEIALFVNSACAREGIRIVKAPKRSGELKCVKFMRDLASRSRSDFPFLLSFVKQVCDQEQSHIPEKLFAALAHLHSRVDLDDGLRNKRLQERILAAGPSAILHEIRKRGEYLGKGGAAVNAAGVLNAINKGLKNRFSMKGMTE